MPESGFSKYIRRADYKTQDIYIDSNDATAVGDILRPLGSRRIYIICSSANLKYKAVRDVISALKDQGFPSFVYSMLGDRCSSTDIVTAFKQFWDYNCNTVISIGNDEDCCLAKMTAAMAACRGKELKDLKGINKVRGTVPVLCHIPMDNGTGGSSAYAHFYDDEEGRIEYVVSSLLLPKIVLIDTDLSLHIPMAESVDSSLCSLAMAVDCYADRDGVQYPEYRADAENACLSFVGNLEKMKANPGDAYLRRNVNVAALYAGMATRRIGAGVSNVTADVVRSVTGKMSGAHCLAITAHMLEEDTDSFAHPMSTLAKAAYLCPANTDDDNGVTTFIEYLRRLCYKNQGDSGAGAFSETEAGKCADEIRRIMGDVFGRKVSPQKIARILMTVQPAGNS